MSVAHPAQASPTTTTPPSGRTTQRPRSVGACTASILCCSALSRPADLCFILCFIRLGRVCIVPACGLDSLPADFAALNALYTPLTGPAVGVDSVEVYMRISMIPSFGTVMSYVRQGQHCRLGASSHWAGWSAWADGRARQGLRVCARRQLFGPQARPDLVDRAADLQADPAPP